jgi:general secretion pathway protein I
MTETASNHPDSHPGFSLIEVLVGLAILGIALGTLMPRISLGSLAAERASRTEEAVLLAEQLLTEAGRTIPLPSNQMTEGQPAEGQPEGKTPAGFSWRLSTCCIRMAANATGQKIAGIVDVRAEVSWLSMRGSQSVALVGRRIVPVAVK